MDDAFLPDPVRAARLNTAIVQLLAASLRDLAAAASPAAGFDAHAMEDCAAGLSRAVRVPAPTFLAYHDALDSARSKDADALAEVLQAVCQMPAGVPPGVRSFADASMKPADWARFRRALNAQAEPPLQIRGVGPACLAAATALLAEAKLAIAVADPALAAEIDILAGEIIFARPQPGGAGFGGATVFQAWGAILLNVDRHRTLVAMAGGLVHEAAHALLMAMSQGAPMVTNDPAERYASPLRADARPMDGIFHATFVSARMTYAMDVLLAGSVLDDGQAAEAVQVRDAACAAFQSGHATVAAHADATPAGQAAMAGAAAYMRSRAITAQASLAAAERTYRAGDYAAAAALLKPWAERPDAPADVLRLLGLCRLHLGNQPEAVVLLARAHTLAGADPWCALHYGIGLQAVGRHAEAAALFRACRALLPRDPAAWLNLSASLLAMGDVQGAITAARRARVRCPGNLPHAHYTLGLARLAAGQFSAAEDCFRQAVRHAPLMADGWVNLGVARYRTGQMDGAKQAMRSALAVDPDHAAASANLGSFLQLTGEIEASEVLLTGIVARRPDAAAARINLAANLLQEDRAQEAIALLGGEPPSGPAQQDRQLAQHWRLQQVLALLKLGRLADARAVLALIGPVPAVLAPLLHWRRTLLAAAERDMDAAGRHAAAMRIALESTPAMLPEHRIMGHYDLAKHFSLLGDADGAFAQWRSGHGLLRRYQPFSRARHAAFVEATIAAFDTARLRHGARAGNRDATPVFVVGMPRSGTTLVEQILSAHAGVHGAGERAALAMMAERLGGPAETEAGPGRIAALGRTSLDAAASAYLADLHALAPGAERIVDKMPGNFRFLGLVGLMLPGARVIACERDPRDIGLSIFTYRFYGAHAYAHDLADLGWYIGQQRRLMAHWRAVLPNPILTVRLTDWVRDFSGTLGRVLDFLELPHDASCERFHMVDRRVRTVSRTQVKEPVNARGLDRWRRFETHLQPMISALLEAGALDDAGWAGSHDGSPPVPMQDHPLASGTRRFAAS